MNAIVNAVGRKAKSAEPVTSQAVTSQPVAKLYRDPAWVVQRAWSVFPLPRLQELIEATIVDLQSLPQPGSLDRESVSAPQPDCDPVAEALRACCEELRDAAGMAGAEADRASHCRTVRVYIEQQPQAWSEAFTKALEGYRRAATKALEHAFTRAGAA